MGRRARVERDDDHGAPLLAARSRPARPGDRPPPRERHRRTPPRRRHLVELVGGPARPLDDDRVVRRAEDGRRRERPEDARVHPARRRDSEEPRLHEVLHGTPRSLAVAADRPDPARDDPAPAERPFLGLQLRLLGAADGRAALGRLGAPAGPPRRPRPPRHRRATRRVQAARPADAAQATRDRRRRALGEGAPGGRRLLGRDPAALGLVDRHARRARPRVRGRDSAPRGRGLGELHGRGRRAPPSGGLPVAGLGHRPRRARPPRRRRSGRAPAATASRRVVARRRGHDEGRLGDPPPEPRPRRLGLRVRERPLPGRGRHRSRRARPARARHGRGRRPPGPRLDRGHAVGERRLGRLRRRQLELLALQAPVLRLRLRDRPAERGRLRARAGGAGPGAPLRRTRSPAASSTSSASSSGTAPGGAAGA